MESRLPANFPTQKCSPLPSTSRRKCPFRLKTALQPFFSSSPGKQARLPSPDRGDHSAPPAFLCSQRTRPHPRFFLGNGGKASPFLFLPGGIDECISRLLPSRGALPPSSSSIIEDIDEEYEALFFSPPFLLFFNGLKGEDRRRSSLHILDRSYPSSPSLSLGKEVKTPFPGCIGDGIRLFLFYVYKEKK